MRNINNCIGNLTDRLKVWEPARKVMLDHPGWDFGRALEYLAEQEGDSVMPRPDDDEDPD